MKEKILEQVDQLKDQMIESILELVKIDSVETEAQNDAPFGSGVRKALDTALGISKKLGFKINDLDHYIGYAQYGEGDDYICAIGHVDVVETGEGWKQPPFSGYIDQETIYSRGVLDNKGPILSCLYGLYALKKLGIKPKRPVRIIFGCDEESGFEDLNYYLKKEKPPVYGFTPDCKYPVVYAERGRAVLKISTDCSQLKEFFHFVTTYFISAKNNGDRLGIDLSHPEYGIMEMRNYKLDTQGKEISFEVTLSYPGGHEIKSILERIQEKAGTMKVTLIKNYDPVVFDKNGILVKTLQECYETVTGQDGTPVTTTGGTYAKAMPNIVPFGPSFPGQKGIGHNPNEWMSIKDLMTNAKIYALSLYRLSQL